jgi:hypothetical protein
MRSYYVIFEDDQWKVKLEKGAVIRSGFSTQKSAIRKARVLGRRNDRTVVVNAKAGYTRDHIKNP